MQAGDARRIDDLLDQPLSRAVRRRPRGGPPTAAGALAGLDRIACYCMNSCPACSEHCLGDSARRGTSKVSSRRSAPSAGSTPRTERTQRCPRYRLWSALGHHRPRDAQCRPGKRRPLRVNSPCGVPGTERAWQGWQQCAAVRAAPSPPSAIGLAIRGRARPVGRRLRRPAGPGAYTFRTPCDTYRRRDHTMPVRRLGVQGHEPVGTGFDAVVHEWSVPCSSPARTRTGPPPPPGSRCRAAGRPTRTRARPSRRRISASTVRMWPGPWRSSAEVIIATSAPTMSALTASVPAWMPDVAASETPGRSCGRRIAIQRIGRRSSDGLAQLEPGDDVEGLEVEVRLVEPVEQDEAVGAGSTTRRAKFAKAE